MWRRSFSAVAKDLQVLKNVQTVVNKVEIGCIPKGLQIQWTPASEFLTKDKFAAVIDDYVLDIDQLIEKNVPDKTVFTLLPDEQRAIEGVQLMLLKFQCLDMKRYFDLMDKDNDGKIPTSIVETALNTYWTGDMKALLHQQFQIFDTDNDGKITQDECVQMFTNLLGVYKASLEELVTKHCEEMTKKHTKQLQKSFVETQWNEKVFEKVRCVFHFGLHDKDEKTLPFDRLYESQLKEFPELNQLMGKYMEDFSQTRKSFYDTRQERRKTLAIGTVFTIAVGFCDYYINIC